MITLHRLGHTEHPLHLNCDLIFTVESTPDTVVTLTTGVKIVVDETPDEVADAVREWRVGIMTEAFNRKRPRRARAKSPSTAQISAVESGSTPA
jgi:flagellar protein FlbD